MMVGALMIWRRASCFTFLGMVMGLKRGSDILRLLAMMTFMLVLFGSGDCARADEGRPSEPGNGKEIRVAVGEWPPMVSETLPEFGKHALRFQTIFEAMGYQVRFVFVPWQRAYEQTRHGVYVATFPWLSTEERYEDFYVPRYPIAQAYQKGFYKPARFPNGVDLSRLADVALLGLRPVGVASYWYEDAFRKLGIAADIVTNSESAWRFLDADRADIMFEEEEVGWYDLERLLGANAVKNYATTKPVTTRNMFILFSHHHPQGKQLMQAFDAFMASEKGQEICKQWSICTPDITMSSD